MTFSDALEVLALTADKLRDTRAKLEKYTEPGVVDTELSLINNKVMQLSKHVTEEAENIIGTLDELDARIDIRKNIITKLKEASYTVTAWIDYFEEVNANTHGTDTWGSLLCIVDLLANNVSSADSELTDEVNGEDENED